MHCAFDFVQNYERAFYYCALEYRIGLRPCRDLGLTSLTRHDASYTALSPSPASTQSENTQMHSNAGLMYVGQKGV